MDTAIKEFNKRRMERLKARYGDDYRSVVAFKARRAARLDAGDYDESKHKRDKNGRFAPKDGGSDGGDSAKPKGKAAASSPKKTGMFPTPKSGTSYDGATQSKMKDLEDKAKTDPAVAKVLKGLSDKDIVYQKDSKGKESACIPGLAHMTDTKLVGCSAEAQKIFDQRVANGKKTTEDMIAIGQKLGGNMHGLAYCYKGGESLGRKINKAIKEKEERGVKGVTDVEILNGIDDAVRYTFMCEHDDLAEKCLAFEDELTKAGYTITQRDNKYLPKYDENGNEVPRDYKGIHLQVKTPTGDLIELQLHSKESMDVKDKNHPIYEKARKLEKSDPEFKRLTQQMIDNTATLKEPRGIRDLPTFGKKKK